MPGRRPRPKCLAYLDVDLSTDLAALPPLVAPLLSGHSDVSIGTRLGQSSRVSRGPKREFISRCIQLSAQADHAGAVLGCAMRVQGIRAEVARRLLPHVEDNGWFFDTELLIIAERSGLRIHEIPVDWVDDPDSRVDIRQTAVGRSPWPGPRCGFAVEGKHSSAGDLRRAGTTAHRSAGAAKLLRASARALASGISASGSER